MQEFHSVCPNLTWDQVWDEHCKTKIKQNNSQPNEISSKAMSFNVQYELFYDPIKTLLFFKEKEKKLVYRVSKSWKKSFILIFTSRLTKPSLPLTQTPTANLTTKSSATWLQQGSRKGSHRFFYKRKVWNADSIFVYFVIEV